MQFSENIAAMVRSARSTFLRTDLASPQIFAANMLFLHDLVIASERLLKEALVETARKPRDAFIARLEDYMEKHLEEETGHLSWLISDMHGAGISPTPLPDPLAMALVGTQYYLLKHQHPASLLGYMASLESDPIPLDTVDALEELHGAQSTKFIREHATKDLKHRKTLAQIIDETPECLRGLIWHSADSSLRYYGVAVASWGNA